MVKGFGIVHKHIQQQCPYPYPNSIFVVPPRFLLTSQHSSTNDFGITEIAHKIPSFSY